MQEKNETDRPNWLKKDIVDIEDRMQSVIEGKGAKQKEIRVLQQKFSDNGLKGFHVEIVPESLSVERYSFPYVQHFSSEEEMIMEDQTVKEISNAREKYLKGDFGLGFSRFGEIIRFGNISSKAKTKNTDRMTNTAVYRKAVWCLRNHFRVRMKLDAETKKYIKTNMDKRSFAKDFFKKYGSNVYAGLNIENFS